MYCPPNSESEQLPKPILSASTLLTVGQHRRVRIQLYDRRSTHLFPRLGYAVRAGLSRLFHLKGFWISWEKRHFLWYPIGWNKNFLLRSFMLRYRRVARRAHILQIVQTALSINYVHLYFNAHVLFQYLCKLIHSVIALYSRTVRPMFGKSARYFATDICCLNRRRRSWALFAWSAKKVLDTFCFELSPGPGSSLCANEMKPSSSCRICQKWQCETYLHFIRDSLSGLVQF